MRILIVDDHPVILRGAERMLRGLFGAHISVATAATAGQAIAAIEAAEPSLIVCDYELLDGSTGRDVLDWIRDRRPELEPRFLLASGNQTAQASGSRFLLKPYTSADLRVALAPELELARALPESDI